MGFYDRQYARRPYTSSGPFGAMQMWSVTTWLIATNVAVYLIDSLTGGRLGDWGYFSADTAIFHLQVWRFITFQFLHANVQHILFNMIALYFFGPMVESWLGPRRYLAFYLLCGIAGAVMYLILWMTGVLFTDPRVPLVGASAGIFGILIGAARIAPNATVLVYGLIPMQLKVMAWILLAIALWVVFSGGENAGGQAAHLGGAALGALLVWQPQWLNLFDRLQFRRRKRRFFMDDRR